jgi:hypothetical protein
LTGCHEEIFNVEDIEERLYLAVLIDADLSTELKAEVSVI